jgi:hypothetical protein
LFGGEDFVDNFVEDGYAMFAADFNPDFADLFFDLLLDMTVLRPYFGDLFRCRRFFLRGKL